MKGAWELLGNQKYTKPERILYQTLKDMGIQYIPQYWVGKYRADAYLPEYNVVIEVDGEYWHSSSQQKTKDARKDKFYKSRGFRVARVPSKVFMYNPEAWIRGMLKRI